MAAAPALNLLTFDAAYLKSLQRRDPSTEQQFVAYFTPLIHRKLRRYFRAHHVIEDAAQETFLRVLAAVRSGKTIRHPERFGAFVHAVCGHVAMEMVRHEQRLVGLKDEHDERPSDSRSPLSLVEGNETRQIVREVLASLSEFDRELLVAIFLNEEDRKVLTRRFGVSREYLRVLLHRAKSCFIEQMEKNQAV